MNTKLILIVILIVLIPAAAYWLATPPEMPPVQKMEQSIPDDHIPR